MSGKEPSGKSSLTMNRLVGSLTLGQAWGVGAALFALIGGGFGLGAAFQPIISKIVNQPGTCATMPGYPDGEWFLRSVKVNIGRADTTFGGEITFTHPTGGVWYAGEGKQLPDGSYPRTTRREFTANPAPKPGAKVKLTMSNAGEDYEAEGEVFVSPDGCSMMGNETNYLQKQIFLDNSAEYCWFQAPAQCPAPPSSAGWRAPRIIGAP